MPQKDSSNYPEIKHAPNARLQTNVRISDLQSLVLYVLADGSAPQWVAVRHHGAIRKVVVLMAPGLEPGMFNGTVSLDTRSIKEDAVPSSMTSMELSEHARNDKRESQIGREQESPSKKPLSPDDYYPVQLQPDKLPEVLKPLADIFPHVWPIKAPGDDKYNRIHSPLQAILTAPLPKTKEEKKWKGAAPPREAKSWQNERTPITAFLATTEQLQDS